MQRLIPDKYVDELLCSPELANSFIEWFIWQTVDSFGTIGLSEIGPAVEENYPINVKAVRDYCKNHFAQANYGCYCLTDEQASILHKVSSFQAHFRRFGEDSGNGVFLTISNAIHHHNGDSSLVCAAVSRLDQIETGRKDIDYLVTFFDYLRYGKSKIEDIKECLNQIIPENRNVPLNILFTNDKIIRALGFGDIRDTKAFLQCNFEDLSDVLFLDFQDIIPVFEGLARPAKEMLHKVVGEYLGLLKGRDENRLYSFTHRYGVGVENGREEAETLEQIGQAIGMTRERARQLILRAEETLEKLAPQMLTYGAMAMRNEFGAYRVKTMNEAKSAFVCLEDLHTLSVAAQLYGDSRICYHEPLDIFYEPCSTRIHDLKFEVLDNLEDVISHNEFDVKRDFEKRIILSEYSMRDSGFYVKKGKPTSYMVTRIIDRFFPSGYHFGGEGHEDFIDLCKCLRQTYGDDYPLPPSARAVEGLIQQQGYCLVDRGTYVSRLSVIEPGIALISAICNYIEEKGPTVYYDSILEKFKDEFEELGVRNAFYVKGLIDPYLEDHGFHTKRNYVQTEKGGATARETMLAFMREQEAPFTVQDLRNRFPGVKYYVFNFAIDENPDILLCGKSEYISAGKCGMTDEGRRLLIQVIEDAIKAGDGITNAHRIYGRLQLFHKDYEKEFGHVKTRRGIFSYASTLSELVDKYDFKRPYIAVKGNTELNHDAVMANHFLKMDSFTIKDCQAYRAKIGINNSGTFSFIAFVDSLSDEFVLADRFLAVKKDILDISDSQLDKIRNTMLMIVRTRGEFDSKDTAALSYFPQVIGNVDLNAYLLMGVVQTYLSDYFAIETEAIGNSLTYTIKEVK